MLGVLGFIYFHARDSKSRHNRMSTLVFAISTLAQWLQDLDITIGACRYCTKADMTNTRVDIKSSSELDSSILEINIHF